MISYIRILIVLGVRLLLEETLPVVQERYRKSAQELAKALTERGFVYVVKEVISRSICLFILYAHLSYYK